jgi:putative phosphoesterase
MSGSEIILGVIGDTHVPDRRREIDPRILPLFQERGVQAILHTGDVSAPFVLEQMARLAPVYAVKGNRDFLRLAGLPMQRRLEFGGVVIGMAHGHDGLFTYLTDRVVFMFKGYEHARLIPRLLAQFPWAQVIVFGHGHLTLNRWIDGKLLFNPGSPHFPTEKDNTPSLGFLHIRPGSDVNGEIVYLE